MLKTGPSLLVGSLFGLSAYFNSPEVADSVTRLVISATTGAVTVLGCNVGFSAGEIITGLKLDPVSVHFGFNKNPLPKTLTVLALTLAAALGSYKYARSSLSDFVVKQQNSQPACAQKVSLAPPQGDYPRVKFG